MGGPLTPIVYTTSDYQIWTLVLMKCLRLRVCIHFVTGSIFESASTDRVWRMLQMYIYLCFKHSKTTYKKDRHGNAVCSRTLQ